METPNSSMRRVTRSQTAAASNNKSISISKLIEDSEQILSKSRQGKKNMKQQLLQESSNNKPSALLDITNNSPIVGIAMGGSLLTPASSISRKTRNKGKVFTAPSSGEALLRAEVKTLLQKVEEEAKLSKLETQPTFPYLRGFVGSPILAPTPANTPQVLNLSEVESTKTDVKSVTSSPNPVQELISQAVNEILDEEKHEEIPELPPITRSLLLDFSEKSEISDASECSSSVTQAEGASKDRKDMSFTDEDSSSVWSIQVNASTHSDEDSEEEEEEEQEEEEDEEEICSGIEKMSIMAVKFEGKHTRFVYNSDDEIVGGDE